jgi:hypothetical protein
MGQLPDTSEYYLDAYLRAGSVDCHSVSPKEARQDKQGQPSGQE